MVFVEDSGVVVHMVIIVAMYKEDAEVLEDVEDAHLVLFQTISVKVVIVAVIFVKVL